eukprot:351891-Prymnesium_polylepis.1
MHDSNHSFASSARVEFCGCADGSNAVTSWPTPTRSTSTIAVAPKALRVERPPSSQSAMKLEPNADGPITACADEMIAQRPSSTKKMSRCLRSEARVP